MHGTELRLFGGQGIPSAHLAMWLYQLLYVYGEAAVVIIVFNPDYLKLVFRCTVTPRLEVRILWPIIDWQAFCTAECILCYITS